MDINNYKIYSAISATNDKSNTDLLKIIEQVENFNQITEINEARKYLNEVWKIEKTVQDFSLCDGCVLNVIDSEKAFCINLVYSNKNKTFYYEK